MTAGSRSSAHEVPFTDRLQRALRQAHDLQPVPVAATPRTTAFESANAKLYRYGPGDGTPLLIVYSLVNRPYILDLAPERSVVARLAAGGFSVYLLEWNSPGPMSRFLTLEDYVLEDVADAVEWVAGHHRCAAIHLCGVCQGGVLALCYAALEPALVRTLTTLVTPVDFHTESDTLYHLARYVDMERVVDAGNVPATALNAMFASLKPFQLFAQRYLVLADLSDNEPALIDFLRMERWMYDSPDQAGGAFIQFARDFYQANGLCRGSVVLDNRPVVLKRITAPIFNVYADKDHLVPPAAARALKRLVSSSDYAERSLKGGHLGVFISARAHRRLYPELVEWLRAR